MAFREIEMWADILNSENAEKTRYNLACKKSMKNSSLLESKEFASEKQTQLDPAAYGFKKNELNESLYQANGIAGKIAIPTQACDGKFSIEVKTLHPSISIKPLVSGSKSGSLLEGKYDELLDAFALNESGCQFKDIGMNAMKQSLKKRFDEAFFSEGVEQDEDPLDETVDLSECGFGCEDGRELDEDDESEFGQISLEFGISDDEEPESQRFYRALTDEYGLDNVTMSKCNMSGPYETCTLTGSKSDLKTVFAIWNGCSSWDEYKGQVGANADLEFEESYEQKLQEADDREPISHGLDFVGVKASTANIAEQDGVEMSLCESKKRKVNEGVLGALGGAALGGLAGAVGGSQIGDVDTASITLDNGDATHSMVKKLDEPISRDQFKAFSANDQKLLNPNIKYSSVGINSNNAAIGAGAGALAGGVAGHYLTKDDKKDEAEEENFNPDDVASDINDAKSAKYEEMLQDEIRRHRAQKDEEWKAREEELAQQDADLRREEIQQEQNEAEEFFGLNEDETSKTLEAKPFRVNWIDSDGEVHSSDVAASDTESAKKTIARKHEGCEIKNVDDLSNVYKEWKNKDVYESMLDEATLADALGDEDLNKLDDLEAKLSDDGMTADERDEKSRMDAMMDNASAALEKPYSGMTKEQISQELTKRHGFVGNELNLFWKVMDVLGYEPTDIAEMTDEEVVDAIVSHIPKGRKHRFQGYIDPMIKNRAFADDGGGQLDDEGKQTGKTGDWKQFQASVVPIEYSPAELDMMHNDVDIDDERQKISKIKQLDRSIKQGEEQAALDDAIPKAGQDTWLCDEVTKLMKSMPRPKARKVLTSIIDDIKAENGITDKYITAKTPAADDVKERCAQDILFLKSLFGKDIGMGPTLRDYSVAWGKDSSGEYVSHTTAGQYNDETEFMITKAMANALGVMSIPTSQKPEVLRHIIDDEELCKKFVENLAKNVKERSYGARSIGKKAKSSENPEQQA